MLKKDNSYLAGRLLLAMPHMSDARFHRAVIFMSAHDTNGAIGIVVNHPIPVMTFKSLLDQFDITISGQARLGLADYPVLAGGPMEPTRGFMIHSKDFVTNDTVQAGNMAISGTLAALKSVAQGIGPKEMRFALGFAGWSAGQLEQEIQDNAWMVVPATHELIFRTAPELMWQSAFATLGVNPSLLSSHAGRA